MRKRNNQIHFYLNDKELVELKGSAQYYNLTVTQYIKAMCNLIHIDNIRNVVTERQEELENWINAHEKEDIVKEEYYFETAEERIKREQEELENWISEHEKDDAQLDVYYENMIDDLIDKQ